MGNSIRHEWLAEGYEILPQFLDPEEVRRLTRSFEQLLSSAKTGGLEPESANYRCVMEQDPFRLHRVVWCEGAEPSFRGWGDEPRFLEAAARHLGSTFMVQLLQQAHFKLPGDGVAFGWHQDAPYWIHDSDHVDKLPNVMVMFDDATCSNGCFRVIDGSHKAGCLPGCDDGRQLAGFYTHPDAFDEDAQVLIECPAGSVVFFDPHIVHGSGVNASVLPRRAMIITYQPSGFATLKSGTIRNVGE